MSPSKARGRGPAQSKNGWKSGLSVRSDCYGELEDHKCNAHVEQDGIEFSRIGKSASFQKKKNMTVITANGRMQMRNQQCMSNEVSSKIRR